MVAAASHLRPAAVQGSALRIGGEAPDTGQVVLAIYRWLHRSGRVKNGRPEGVLHHGDNATGWEIGTHEFRRRMERRRESHALRFLALTWSLGSTQGAKFRPK